MREASITRWVPWLLVAVLTIVAAGAVAGQLAPLTSAGPEGEVRAEVPVTLGWVLTDEEGQPAFHQDARFEVRFEDETLVRVPPSSGHDYDGVDPYRVAFPGPGNYTVMAAVHDDGEIRELTYEGTVNPAPERSLDVELDVPDTARPGQLTQLTAELRDPQGQPVGDTEVTIRIQRAEDRFEILKTRLDADGEATLGFAFDRAGMYEVRAIATPLPGGTADRLGAASTSATITVDGSPSPAPGAPTERPLLNDRATGEQGGEYELFGTYDPYTSVGPHGRLRLGMLTLEPGTHTPVRDVSYRATILDPDGRQVFHSTDLHAADGFEYVTLNRAEPGTYTMRVDAAKDGWKDHTVLTFSVLPPIGATNNGPLMASPNATTQLEAGTAATFPIHVQDTAGVPLLHGEVDVVFADADTGVPWVAGKLHVHENGTMPITLTPFAPGEQELSILPQSLQPAPTPYTWGEQVGQPPSFDVEVAQGAGDELLTPQEETDEERDTPTAGALVVTIVLALAGAASQTSRDR